MVPVAFVIHLLSRLLNLNPYHDNLDTKVAL